MIYCQAKKFINKSVYVIKNDTSVIYGTLTKVLDITGYVLTASGEEVKTHIKHIYPKK